MKTVAPRTALLALFVALFLVVVLRAAWICDDAYITFRTVENFLSGHGLRYNPAERVQAYTHPLWLAALLPFRLATGEYYYASLALSLLASLGALGVLALGIARDTWMAIFGVTVLTLSTSFVDYSTSGLENPLSHLFLVLFFWVFFQTAGEPPPERRAILLFGLASLSALTRLDAVLVLLPALAVVGLGLEGARARLVSLLGLLPLVLWELVSVVYYGFPFPNTAYAKLGTGIPRSELLEQGALYFVSSLARDPLGALVILGALAICIARFDVEGMVLGSGILLHGAYLLAIGGDFMAGRFLTPMLLLAVVALVASVRLSSWPFVAAALLVVGVGLAPNPYDDVLRDERTVTDERAYYYPHTGLLSASRRTPAPTHSWALDGIEARESGRLIAVRDAVGLFGFYAGPRVHVLDYYALTDPLLARLPSRAEPNWRPGHFAREIPEGYLRTLESGENALSDEGLARLYERLELVTRGPIFALERFAAILTLNLGGVADDVDFERYRYPRRRELSVSESGGAPRRMTGSGARVALETTARSHVEIALDCDDDYRVRFFRRARELGERHVEALCLDGGGLRLRTVLATETAHAEGFDAIWVLPERGRRPYAVGRVRAR